jgi:short-subunit dehydrogenase
MNFTDKRVLITGGSSGIGEALAYEFSKLNSKVIIASNQPEELKRVQDECNKIHPGCEFYEFDLSSQEDVQKKAEEIIKTYGGIDILINNGGISTRTNVLDTSIDIDRLAMEINYFSGVVLTKAFLPIMLKQGSGYIVATSSIAGDFGFPLRSAYSASKHAVYGFYESVRAEYLDQGIGVTIAAPGRVQTNISVNALDKDGKPHGKMDPGQANGITVEKCAKAYIKAIRKNKPRAYIGGKEILMVHIKRFFPRIFFKIVRKIDPT